MAGAIIWYVTIFGCAALFFGIGVYAQRLEKPMHFWSGSQIDPKEITDVEQYNHENGIMWKVYALWYALAGLAYIWSLTAALILLLSSCFVGIPLLIVCYNRIYRKYKAK